MTDSRANGCRGELEAAKAWAEVFGVEARRGQQFAGSTDSPDILTSHSDIHVEVKRTERGNPYDWLTQAVRDAGKKCPLVLHRRNNREWIMILRLSDAPRLAKEITKKAQEMGGFKVPPEYERAGLPTPPFQDGRDAGVLPAE